MLYKIANSHLGEHLTVEIVTFFILLHIIKNTSS